MTLPEFDLRIQKSKIDGNGLFAFSKLPARRKIGELTGEIISTAKARKLAKQLKRIAIVELNEDIALDATNYEDKLKYINHSCKPNTYVRIITTHVEFYTLREIKKYEELTADYGETHHDGKLRCNCGCEGCIGFL